MKRMPIMAIHEPNIMSYMSGANMVCAESGVNPRDVAADTKDNRGWDVVMCRELLKEAGFSKIILGDDTAVSI
jgi:biotin synthase